MKVDSPNIIPVMLMARELGPGGTERQLTEIARHLDRNKFNPSVGCFLNGIRTTDLMAAGVPVSAFPVNSFTNSSALRGAWQLGRSLRRHKIQIVHTFDAPLNAFGAPVARAFGVPKVISSLRAHRNLSKGLTKFLRFTDRISDAVVVNCEYLREHLKDEGVQGDKIRLCYNGLDTSVFYPNRQPGPFTIGVTCVLRPEKGLITLMRAFAKIRPLLPAMKLCIVGSGEMLPKLQELAATLNVVGDTHFEPAARDVRPWLNRMDVFVLPSLDEALSNGLMEAMACGCTGVASRVGGNPELVLTGKTGLLFEKENVDDLAAQLRILIEQPEALRRMSAAGASRIAKEFSIETSVHRMEEIYREVLNG